MLKTLLEGLACEKQVSQSLKLKKNMVTTNISHLCIVKFLAVFARTSWKNSHCNSIGLFPV